MIEETILILHQICQQKVQVKGKHDITIQKRPLNGWLRMGFVVNPLSLAYISVSKKNVVESYPCQIDFT